MAKRKQKVSYPGLLNDIMFKIVFGGTQSEAVLRYLLNALLDLRGPDKVVELAILSPNPEKFFFDDKGPVLDLRAQDRRGSYYHVEVQLRGTDLDYIKRSLYYTARLYSDQLKSGHDYHLLERSVSISILDFVLFSKSDKLHSTFSLWDRTQDFQLTQDLELHYIELPKFTPDKPKSLQTRFEKWLYILKFSDLYHTRELPENLREEEGIQMAIDAMRKAYAQDEIRAVIEAQEKAKRDEISRISFAERKGREEGLEEGLEKGREQQQRASVLEIIEARFESVPGDLRARLKKVRDPEKLRALIRKSATAPTLTEFLGEL